MTTLNNQWILASHPQGMPVRDNWRLEQTGLPEPGPNQILARAAYLSVDPYMRGRISAKQGYAKGVNIGDVMCGGAVAEVVASNHADWQQGDLVETINFGWQEYAILETENLTRVDPRIGPPHAWLSYLGMPGITAWIALRTVGTPKRGETVLVSAASGAVGQVVGQLAKAQGCRAVAVASSKTKLDWCLNLGYDAAVSYRDAEDLALEIRQACPDGIDIFFDNTAGPIHDAAMQNLALRARVIVVGTISLSGTFEQPDMGERFLRQILVNRALVKGFLVFDHLDMYDEARRALAACARNGQLKYQTDFMDGIERMPEAFLKLLHSQNVGKQLVRTELAGKYLERLD